MESEVLEHNFNEISTMIVADVVKHLEDKASSTRAMSQAFSGILGAERAPSSPAGGLGGGARSLNADPTPSATMGTESNMHHMENRFPDPASDMYAAVDHPPSVMLSPSAMECASANGGDWMSPWPNVTLPGYNAIGSAMLGVSHSRAVVFAPLLRDYEGSLEWQEYAAGASLPATRDTVAKGIRSSGGDAIEYQHLFEGSGYLRAPAWQIAPAQLMDEGIMWDYYSHPQYKGSIERIVKWDRESRQPEANGHDNGHDQRRSVLTHDEMGEPIVAGTELFPCEDALLPVHLNPAPNMPPIALAGTVNGGHDLHRRRTLESPPVEGSGGADVCTAIFHPVYDTSPSSGPDSPANLTGVVAEVFTWSDVLMDIVNGHGKHEVRVIVESSMTLPDGSEQLKSATYIVDDYGATLIERGRVTESRHEAMKQCYDFAFANDAMTYKLHIYPTDVLCHEYGISKTPAFLSVIAACFFFLSVIVFFVYDYFVK